MQLENSKNLNFIHFKKILQANVREESLQVSDPVLEKAIQSELKINTFPQNSQSIPEIFKLIPLHFDSLIPNLEPEFHHKLEFGFAH
jgi:hypothetical protein